LGSAFAGVKAGILAGIIFSGSIGLFNVILLYLLKADVLKFTSGNGCAGIVAGGSVPTPEECFTLVLTIYVPFFMFLIFIISLFFAASYGRFLEYIPGQGYRTKSTSIALILLILLLVLGLGGISFELVARISILVFNLFMAVVYGFVLGSLYKRYTRLVEFVSPDPSSLVIRVDGKNFTGKTRTFSLRSSHAVKAVTSGEKSFKEWAASGGVVIEDSKSFETSIEINGDGMLKAALVQKS
jgi:hypothetical protein